MADMRERLIELIVERENRLNRAVSLADHLIENGVIVLPCKVGDTVYQLDTAGDIYESKITKIIYDTNGIAFDETAIGTSIFRTEAEAEQALKEREE